MIAGVVLGASGGVGAALLGSIRAAKQPIESSVPEEEAVLAYLERDPAQWLRAVGVLHEEDFTSAGRRETWRGIETSCRALVDGETIEKVQLYQAAQDERGIEESIAALRRNLGGSALEREDVKLYLEAGGGVISTAAGRAQNTERSPIEESATGDPYVRRYVPAGVGRLVWGSIFGTGTGMLAAWTSYTRFEGWTAWLGLLGIVALGVGGICISFVDFDTFYLDTASFWVWAAVSWVTTGWAVIAEGGGQSVAIGIGASFGVVLGFESLARIWGKLRGITQGAGDTWIVVCTAGIPAMVAGTWQVAAWSVIAAASGAVLHWTYLAAFRGAGRETPVPFGPWLVAGGLASMGLWTVLQ